MDNPHWPITSESAMAKFLGQLVVVLVSEADAQFTKKRDRRTYRRCSSGWT